MQLGMIGLGRMGANIVRRLLRQGHQCVVFDRNPATVNEIASEGATGAASYDDFVAKLARPRAAWLMVPAVVTGEIAAELAQKLEPGDIIIDGGNSYYRDDIDRARQLQPRGIHYVDCGTSGGVWGLQRGFCLMIGGDREVVEHLDPIFRSIAPGVEAAPRTPGRTGEPRAAEHGYLYCGPNGAGHFVKMVHNGVEYGLMAAYAEGLNIIRHANAGLVKRDGDAETAPLRDPDYYKYEIDIGDVAEVWRRGSVVASWLLDLTSEALVSDSGLEMLSGHVSDSGEGRWTTQAAVDEAVPAPVITAALYGRFESRGYAEYADRLLSAMRRQFGGHEEKRSA